MKERACKEKGEREPKQQLLNLTLSGGKKRTKSAKLLPSLSPLTVLVIPVPRADELLSALRLSCTETTNFPQIQSPADVNHNNSAALGLKISFIPFCPVHPAVFIQTQN